MPGQMAMPFDSLNQASGKPTLSILITTLNLLAGNTLSLLLVR